MAKEVMITRTVLSTKVVALCLDTATCEPSNKDFVIAGKVADDKALTQLRKEQETEDFKIVKIVSSETQEKLYGLSISKFMEHAVELDEKRNPIPNENPA